MVMVMGRAQLKIAGINNVSLKMAVARINNVSVLESRWDNQEMLITRTSYIRKMWHDLEEESKNREIRRSLMGSQYSCSSQGAESDNVSITTSELESECPPDQNQMEMRVQNGDVDNGISCLQQSPAISTADKERVRQVFRETGQSVIEQALEIGSRKSIRMLFGIHVLLDLLKSFELGRQKENQSLLENGPVSNFAHRNRLQVMGRAQLKMTVAGINNVSVKRAQLKMVVAGINNVSVLESRWGNQELLITRTSYIRKMWPDLEEESKNKEIRRSLMGSQYSCSSQGDESDNVSITTSELENECPPDQNQTEMRVQNGDVDNGISCLQQSPAISTTDKERVRKVFRETGQSVIEQALEIGSRKSIRMLFDIHVLLDLLKSFELRRQKENQSLLENGPVSNFAHRNRLQSLLRGRFLWNQRFVQDKKSTSVTASELGLLRQTHTVSDLRADTTVNEQTHDEAQSDTSSNNGMNYIKKVLKSYQMILLMHLRVLLQEITLKELKK